MPYTLNKHQTQTVRESAVVQYCTAQELGTLGEYHVWKALRSTGLRVEFAGCADLLVEDSLAIEVKTARLSTYKPGRKGYQFCLHRKGQGRKGIQAPVVVFLCADASGNLHDAYIIPADELQGKRKVTIPSEPDMYNGYLAQYRENWEIIADFV